MNQMKPYLKAIVGGLTSAISFAIPVVDDGLVASEGLGSALAFLIGLGVTYAVPNLPSKPKRDPNLRA